MFYAASWDPEAVSESVVYCTSRSSPLKALPSLLDAVAILRRSTKPKLRLRIGGDLQGGVTWPMIRRRLSRVELRGAVDMLGVLTPTNIAAELMTASLFVHPSHIDNSPNALCEALLMGVPSVASNVGGVPSLVENGHTGLLYPDNDPFMLAGAIDLLLDDRRAGTAGRARGAS